LSGRFISKIAFLFIPLALAVFTWGLQYKLSLYDPPQAISHRMIEAKLLSEEERPSPTDSSFIKDSKAAHEIGEVLVSCVFFLSLIALGSLSEQTELQAGRDTEFSWRPCRLASLNAFFFRPPPRLA
jgi:hypothetical protein